jgi:NADP-dependent 3-hydroxy acid dehydrogenase YdfG
MKKAIEGKVIIITGASSGMGEASAILLAAHGAKVVLGARRADRLKAVAERIRKDGGECVFLETDVTSRDELTRLTALAIESFGRLDVMINNAGISQLDKLEALDIAGWEQMIDVNLKGTLYGIAAALPIFTKQGSGHIINIISTAGISIVPTMGVYAATKNAVRTITEALRQESEGRWRVTGISPGYVATEFANNIRNEAVRSHIQSNSAKMAIPAEAIARAVLYTIEQPDNVDVGDIVIRPTVQG